MTDLEIINEAKNKAIIRAEKAEKQIEKLEKIIEQMQDAKCVSCTDLGGMLLKITDLVKKTQN